jgi:hypothetical protein
VLKVSVGCTITVEKSVRFRSEGHNEGHNGEAPAAGVVSRLAEVLSAPLSRRFDHPRTAPRRVVALRMGQRRPSTAYSYDVG